MLHSCLSHIIELGIKNTRENINKFFFKFYKRHKNLVKSLYVHAP